MCSQEDLAKLITQTEIRGRNVVMYVDTYKDPTADVSNLENGIKRTAESIFTGPNRVDNIRTFFNMVAQLNPETYARISGKLDDILKLSVNKADGIRDYKPTPERQRQLVLTLYRSLSV